MPGLNSQTTCEKAAVAIAVVRAAVEDGLAQADITNPIQQVHRAMWRPQYPRLKTEPLCVPGSLAGSGGRVR